MKRLPKTWGQIFGPIKERNTWCIKSNIEIEQCEKDIISTFKIKRMK